MSNKEYILSWIREIAPKVAPSKSFEDWISGFESRYGQELVAEMKKIWDEYR